MKSSTSRSRTLTLLALASHTTAEPLQPPSPQITPAATTYATTKTHIQTTTKTSLEAIQWISPRVITHLSTLALTTLEPSPILPPYPATVTQTVITHLVYSTIASYLQTPLLETSSTEYVVTVPQTWVVSPPEPTHLSPGISLKSLPCPEAEKGRGEVCEKEANPDGTCEREGMRTACLGQCERRDGLWWCYMMRKREFGEEGRMMGRACWGEGLRFGQLNVPCEEGDVPVGCRRCEGWDLTWGAVEWIGPGR